MRGRRRRWAGIVLASVLAHMGLLAWMGLSVPRPYRLRTASSEPAVRISLLPRRPPPPAQSRRAAASAAVRLHVPPRPLPQGLQPEPLPLAPPPVFTVPAPASVGAPAPTVGPASPQARTEAFERLGRALRTHTACSDPDAAGMTRAEREACEARLARTDGRPPLGLGIAPGKLADFDREVRCREQYERAHMPNGLETSNAAGGMAGLGYVPKLRDCPPVHR